MKRLLFALLAFAAAACAPPGAQTQGYPPTSVYPTDCSGTIAAGGTAQNAIAAQAAAHGFVIQNIDTTEPLWISFTGTAAAAAAGSFALPPGAASTYAGLGAFTTPAGWGTQLALSVVAVTTGHKFSCARW